MSRSASASRRLHNVRRLSRVIREAINDDVSEPLEQAPPKALPAPNGG
jgi:hypothetical protein